MPPRWLSAQSPGGHPSAMFLCFLLTAACCQMWLAKSPLTSASEVVRKTLKISVLLPAAKHNLPQMSLEQVMPVVEVAVASARSVGLLAGLGVQLLSNNSECDYTVAPVIGMLMLKEVDLMLGPYCSFCLGAVARYNRYHLYRRPIVTSGGGASVVNNKEEYYNLIRVGPNHNQIEDMLLQIFRHYGWLPRPVQTVLIIGPLDELNAPRQQSESDYFKYTISETIVMSVGMERRLAQENSYIVRRLSIKTGVAHLEVQLFRVLREEVRSKRSRAD